MLSLQTTFSSKEGKVFHGLHNSSKKRRWGERDEGEIDDSIKAWKMLKSDGLRRDIDIELHLETPLPLEWQRCLDIQSGEIHFYNTRTHKRTSRDPRRSSEAVVPPHLLSLDLELHLNCESPSSQKWQEHHIEEDCEEKHNPLSDSKDRCNQGLSRSPMWVAGEEEDLRRRGKMVAAACMRCHMLVMLCESAPTCPNCKFMHPHFRPGFRLLCCKD
ncbi:hypothetical protein QJS04_geneDACA011923 [Acorus gramineus]|uniref:WW domain-containing protein n=1 Tax=Acorus gramineus TaxID=55184 RepID=A0AAV9AH10_ACOGR|nr:hypothetical protein QJS04_geneDACA011923 [Acorus gramineus]